MPKRAASSRGSSRSSRGGSSRCSSRASTALGGSRPPRLVDVRRATVGRSIKEQGIGGTAKVGMYGSSTAMPPPVVKSYNRCHPPHRPERERDERVHAPGSLRRAAAPAAATAAPAAATAAPAAATAVPAAAADPGAAHCRSLDKLASYQVASIQRTGKCSNYSVMATQWPNPT